MFGRARDIGVPGTAAAAGYQATKDAIAAAAKEPDTTSGANHIYLYGNPGNPGQKQRIKQALKGSGKVALGVGLIGTIAVGDVPGSAAGAVVVASALIGSAVTTVSGIVDIAGAASKTDVGQTQDALEATGNLGGLVVFDATQGNLGAAQGAATIMDAASLAINPKDAAQNAFTVVDAGRTVASTSQMVQTAWGNIKSQAVDMLRTLGSMMATIPSTPR